jgi:GT2 family glycosyltransferase
LGGTQTGPPHADGPRVSNIILGFRNADRLRNCLASIADSATAVSFETIVVANGASPDVLSVLDETPAIRVVQSEINRGFAGGCNLGARAAQGELLMLLNDDVEVQPGWLDALVATADAHPDAGAIGCRTIYTDGTLHEAGSIVWADGSTSAVGRGLPGATQRWRYLRRVDYCSAAALLVRSSLWRAVGGMDEGYHPGYCEDVDLCFAIQQTGARIFYEPRSVVCHHESSSFEASGRGFLQRRGRARLAAKWGQRLTLHEADPTSPGAVERAVHQARGFPRRILVVTGSADAGSWDWLTVLAGGLDPNRYAVVACVPEPAGGQRAEPLQALGVEFAGEPMERHIKRPQLIYDAVVLGPRAQASREELALHQGQAAVIEASGGPGDAGAWQDALSAAMLGRSTDTSRSQAGARGGT